MERHFDTALSNKGLPMVGLTVTVTDANGNNATLYSDNGVTQMDNPIYTDQNGAFSFYAANGRYTIKLTADGVAPVSISDIILNDPQDKYMGDTQLAAGLSADLQSTTNGKGVDLVANATKKVASITALRALRVPQGSDAQTVIIDGQETPIIWSPTSTRADDGGTVFMPNSLTSGQAGRWLRVFSGAYKPVWFGAVGDRVTDDTSALQTLFNVAPDYAEIDLGGKSYFISAGIVSANRYQLVHNGYIKWTSATNQFNALTVRDGTTVLGVRFYGSGAIGSSGNPLYQRGIYGGASTPAPVLAPANNVKVLLCRFENMTVGVWSGGQGSDAVPTGWKVLNNHFENIVGYRGNSEGYGCLFTPSSNGVISGNTFKTIARHAIYLAGGASFNAVGPANIIDTTDNVAIQLNTYSTQPVTQFNKIFGNIINNVTKSIAYGYRSSVGIGIYGKSSNNTIEKNTITGFLDTGIDHSSVASDNTSAIAGVNNIIRNNYVDGSNATDACIRTDNPDGATVESNRLTVANGINGIAQGFTSGLTPALRSTYKRNEINCLGASATGIRMTSTGVANEIADNSIIGTLTHYNDTGSGNIYSETAYDLPGIESFSANKTLTAGASRQVQTIDTALTAGIVLTLAHSNTRNGATFRIIRGANATGADVVYVADETGGTFKTLTAAGQSVEATYNGSNWIETGYSTL